MSKKSAKAAERLITQFHEAAGLKDFKAYEPGAGADGDPAMLAPRLQRAAANQFEHGTDVTTLSRYAIWAETVRGLVVESAEEIESGRTSPQTSLRLTAAANSLAAFSELQRLVDG